MNRRRFIAVALAAPALAWRGALGQTPHLIPPEIAATQLGASWRQFEVTTRIRLADAAGPARLWLPLVQTAAGYQSAVEPSWTTDQDAEVRIVQDGRYGARMLRAEWSGGPKAIEVVQRVATHERGALPLVSLSDAERRFWTEPTPSAPTDGLVRETALRVVAGQQGDRARLRALYDWVVDTTYRRAETSGCGTGDYASMLKAGTFGGKCADISGLLVGMARSIGLPARDVYGIRVAKSRLSPSLGRDGDISKAQHCRAEVFLQDEGWFPVDPADVRKVVLEQNAALDTELIRDLRERMFGQWEMNWIGYNSATDVELPGAAAGERPNFAFLMYPCAFTPAGQPDCLDPAAFHYDIQARELTT